MKRGSPGGGDYPAAAIPAGAAVGAASARNGGSTTTAATTPALACGAWRIARMTLPGRPPLRLLQLRPPRGRLLSQGPRRRPAAGRGQDRRRQAARPARPRGWRRLGSSGGTTTMAATIRASACGAWGLPGRVPERPPLPRLQLRRPGCHVLSQGPRRRPAARRRQGDRAQAKVLTGPLFP